MTKLVAAVVALVLALAPEARGADRTFPAGSLVIPMDLSYQAHGNLQAYGLIYQLLRQNVRVYWVIDPDKTYHAAACNTPGDTCAWDCAVEGSGVKCPFPTASPDVTATATVVWDDTGTTTRGTVVGTHRYRGGPFVVDAADAARALPIIDAWNDQALWPANPWAMRTVFEVVTVHEASAAFTGNVMKEMVAAPTIALFSDGNENIATEYMRAAGIPQSNGNEFPASKCGAANCGPGTANPDMLTTTAVMGDLGTCAAPDLDHENGALFRDDGLPAYCQIMSMHWNVTDRERVECAGGGCPASQSACGNAPITYNGHEVVAEVRAFLQYPVHFFAECQAVNAYENTTPNPAWPFLDDAGRDGHFLTTTGTPPPCPCATGFQCVNNACVPKDIREVGAGFLIAPQPSAATLQVLRPNIPYNQFDGAFATVGGSEPAYNLSTYLGTEYKNDRQVTLITSAQGPGVADVWMSGYLDGGCDIGPIFKGGPRETCANGKISYLGGHSFDTKTPLASGSQSMGARLFLNALFEADCVTELGQPSIVLDLSPLVIPASSLPVTADVVVGFANQTAGAALDATLVATVPTGVTVRAADANGAVTDATATWDVGSISGMPARQGDPPPSGARTTTLEFAALGDYEITVEVAYEVGSTTLHKTQTFIVQVAPDQDGDGLPDPDDGGGRGGGCCSADAGAAGPSMLGLGVVALLSRRRRRDTRR